MILVALPKTSLLSPIDLHRQGCAAHGVNQGPILIAALFHTPSQINETTEKTSTSPAQLCKLLPGSDTCPYHSRFVGNANHVAKLTSKRGDKWNPAICPGQAKNPR